MKALAGATHGEPETIRPDGVDFPGSSLGYLVRWAYGLHEYQTFETAGPDWMNPGLGCIWFHVLAKAGHPVSVAQLKLMMRALLAERLDLSVHRESKNMTVAALSVGADGPKLHSSEKEDMTVRMEGAFASPDSVWHFEGASLSRLYETLYSVVPYLILDETGLEGRYDFDLKIFQYKDLANPPALHGQIDLSPAVNQALRPLGLKLELKRRPVEVLVVDHAEKTPVEN